MAYLRRGEISSVYINRYIIRLIHSYIKTGDVNNKLHILLLVRDTPMKLYQISSSMRYKLSSYFLSSISMIDHREV